MPFLLRATMSSRTSPLEDRLGELDFIGRRLTDTLGPESQWLSDTVRSYVMLSLEFLRLQKLLEKSGRYLLATEQEARERVYDNPHVFGGYYLPGVLLSQALWPNHFLMDRLFRETFLPRLRASSRVLEVGVGTGYHLHHLLRTVPDAVYVGQDISDYAIDHCRRFVFGEAPLPATIRFEKRGIGSGCALTDKSMDAFVLGEILEHVEDPGAVLRELLRVGREGALVFMTTVVFAANIDHLYLFETVAEIRDLVTAHGWEIEADWTYPVHESDTPDMARRPMNHAAILVKPTRTARS